MPKLRTPKHSKHAALHQQNSPRPSWQTSSYDTLGRRRGVSAGGRPAPALGSRIPRHGGHAEAFERRVHVLPVVTHPSRLPSFTRGSPTPSDCGHGAWPPPPSTPSMGVIFGTCCRLRAPKPALRPSGPALAEALRSTRAHCTERPAAAPQLTSSRFAPSERRGGSRGHRTRSAHRTAGEDRQMDASPGETTV
jgi:hypothetical protein